MTIPMTIVTSFFRDRRGIAIADYGFAAALIVTASHLASRYGDAVSMALKHAIPGLA